MVLDLHRPARKRSISLTPLIDVVFILLLFFMLTSQFVHIRQIDVSAMTSTKLQQQVSKPVVIKMLNDNGDFKWQGNLVSVTNPEKIIEIVEANPKAVFVIEAVKGIKTQTMIKVLDRFKQSGAQSVTLAGIN